MRLPLLCALLLLCGAALVAPAEAQGSWTCTFDFSQGQQGWVTDTVTSGNRATWTGSSWSHINWYNAPSLYRRGIVIFLNFAQTTLTSISISNTYTVGAGMSSTPRARIFGAVELANTGTSSSPGNPFTWTGSHTTTTVSVDLTTSSSSSNTYSGSASITSITMTGTGTAPCAATPTPIPATSVPTATPYIINTFATPTPIAIDGSGIYEALQQGNDSVIGLPADLAAAGRPPTEDGSEIFGYVKWLVSPSSADELAGPFAPIVSHTGIFLSVTFAMAVIYAAIWAVVWLFRFVVWIVKFIFLIVDLALQVAQAVGAFIGGIVKLLLGG
jgi:hypothetical protein